mgnify:CR=1 FL=1
MSVRPEVRIVPPLMHYSRHVACFACLLSFCCQNMSLHLAILLPFILPCVSGVISFHLLATDITNTLYK